MSGDRKAARILSLLSAVLCVLVVILGARMMKAREGFTLGDFSGIRPEDAAAAYEDSGDVHDLIYLLKVLCFQAEVEGNEAVTDDIAGYGTTLLDMARAEEIDLEVLGDADEQLLELLRMIRAYGAR